MKQVYLIHGWGGNPKESWFPWLKKELKKRKIKVIIPKMPNTNHPKIEEWIKKIREIIKKPSKNTILIGHSIGCQAIMRYLERLEKGAKVSKVIFIAGWFNLTDEVWDENYTKDIAEPWINTPINFNKIKSHSNSFIVIASDDGPYVSLEDVKIFEKELNAKTIILKNKGHICQEYGVKEFPEILEFIK